jgi:hypothetical protein
MELQGLGRWLILGGVVLVVLGLLVTFFSKIPFLGKLPGDIFIKKEGFTFYFPLATSILLSLLLSLVMYILKKIN